MEYNELNNRHIANVELAKVIKEQIKVFFEEDNKPNYLKYYTEAEARELRYKGYNAKNSSIIKVLSKELDMSEKTFYHMLTGRNSQFDKVVKVLDFFGLTFRYTIFPNEEAVAETLLKDIDDIPSKVGREKEVEVTKKLLNLPKESFELINSLLDKLSGTDNL